MSTTTSAEFEKATDYSFREDDIERAKALVGHYAPSSAREHLTEARHDAMRNFARSYGDDNARFNADLYATSHRTGAQIAPPMTPISPEERRGGNKRGQTVKQG